MHSLLYEFTQKRTRVPKKWFEPHTGPCQQRRAMPKRPTILKRPPSLYHPISEDLDVYKKIGASEWRLRLAVSANVPEGCFATFPSEAAAVAFAIQQRGTHDTCEAASSQQPKKRSRAPDKRRNRVRPIYPRKRAKRETPASPASELGVSAEIEALLSSNTEEVVAQIIADSILEKDAVTAESPDTLACEELLDSEGCEWSSGASPFRLADSITDVVPTDSRLSRQSPHVTLPASELDVPAEVEALLSSNVEEAVAQIIADSMLETDAVTAERPDTLACEELLDSEGCEWSSAVSPFRLPDSITDVVPTDSRLSGPTPRVLARVVRTPSVLDSMVTFTLKPLAHTQKPKMIFATTIGYAWEKPVNYTFNPYVAPTTPPPVPQKKKRTPPGPKKPTWYDMNAELLLLSSHVLRQTSQLLGVL